jgi:predicted methyltransferase
LNDDRVHKREYWTCFNIKRARKQENEYVLSLLKKSDAPTIYTDGLAMEMNQSNDPIR